MQDGGFVCFHDCEANLPDGLFKTLANFLKVWYNKQQRKKGGEVP